MSLLSEGLKSMIYEIRLPERSKPQNKEGKVCECMGREYLLLYKKCILHWLFDEGDEVLKGDVLAEAETEKKVFEVIAPADGVLVDFQVEDGAEFTGSDLLACLDTEA